MRSATVLQTAAHTDRRVDLSINDKKSLAVLTGIEPATSGLKILRLYQVVYSTIHPTHGMGTRT
jgi:hypothetical protein